MSETFQPEIHEDPEQESNDSKYPRIKHALEYLKRTHDFYVKREKKAKEEDFKPWLTFDSGLEFSDTGWEGFGFNNYFREVLEGETIPGYLKEKYKRPINIAEFGGQFRKASREIKEDVDINESLGLVLNDPRSEEQQWEDAEDGHSVVTGDMFLSSYIDTEDRERKNGLEEVKKWIEKNGKIDFLIIRPIGPLMEFENTFSGEEKRFNMQHATGMDVGPIDADIMKAIFLKNFLRWYETLSEDGTVLADCPGDISDLIENMSKKFVDKDGNPLFEIKTEDSKIRRIDDLTPTKTHLLLHRLPGSPDKIKMSDLLE